MWILFNAILTFLSRDYAALPFTHTHSRWIVEFQSCGSWQFAFTVPILEFRRVGFLCPSDFELIGFPLPKAGNVLFSSYVVVFWCLAHQYLASGNFVKSAIGLPPLIEERIGDENYANPGRIMRRTVYYRHCHLAHLRGRGAVDNVEWWWLSKECRGVFTVRRVTFVWLFQVLGKWESRAWNEWNSKFC